MLHDDTQTVAGGGLALYSREPKLKDGEVVWEEGTTKSLNEKIVRPSADPFQATGGLKRLSGTLGNAVMKVSAVKSEHQIVEAPVRVFHDQETVKAACRAGEITQDTIIVVRFQGPKANGMPELHSLTPALKNLQARGINVALVTDGRMSGASGSVPAAIHVSPEALDGGAISKLQDGDVVRVDAVAGVLEILTEGVLERAAATADMSGNEFGLGRELFAGFRRAVGTADTGACSLF